MSLLVSLLVGQVLLVGCATSHAPGTDASPAGRDRTGWIPVAETGPNVLVVEATQRTEPHRPAPSPRDLNSKPELIRPSPEDQSRITRLYDDGFDRLIGGDYVGAVRLFTEAQTMERWIQSRQAEDLLYWLGHAYDQLDERQAAMATYRRLVERFPDSPLAPRARRRITDLEAGPTK